MNAKTALRLRLTSQQEDFLARVALEMKIIDGK